MPCGEGVRNVLSVIEPPLSLLCKNWPRPLGVLTVDEPEFCLCKVRRVCTWPTFVGPGDIVRSAAAAAEAERFGVVGLLARKAIDAAEWAADEAFALLGRIFGR